MDSQLKKRMVDEIEWYKYAGMDGTGEYSYEKMQIKNGYVESKVRTTTDDKGAEIVTNTTIYLDGNEYDNITNKDECKTPYGPRRRVKAIIPYRRYNTVSLIEVLL